MCLDTNLYIIVLKYFLDHWCPGKKGKLMYHGLFSPLPPPPLVLKYELSIIY
jgi:hypothetical protein